MGGAWFRTFLFYPAIRLKRALSPKSIANMLRVCVCVDVCACNVHVSTCVYVYVKRFKIFGVHTHTISRLSSSGIWMCSLGK